jgi:hypothetical protein
MKDQQVFKNIHRSHHTIYLIALQDPDDACEVTVAISHPERIVPNFGHTASWMIRCKDVKPAIG